MVLAVYLVLKSLFLILSGCIFIAADLYCLLTASGVSMSVMDTSFHYGHTCCRVANNVVTYFNTLPYEYPHFYLKSSLRGFAIRAPVWQFFILILPFEQLFPIHAELLIYLMLMLVLHRPRLFPKEVET